MKTLSKIALATVLSVSAMGANAAINYGAGQPYVGVKVGQVDTDVMGINKKATNYGVYGGYNFDQNFGVEVEYLGSEDKSYNIGAANYEYNAKTYGAYGTYRYHFANTPVYLKGKLGIAKTEVKDKGINTSWVGAYDQTSFAGGVGVGVKAGNNLAIEAGYNYLNSDVNSWGIGASLAF